MKFRKWCGIVLLTVTVAGCSLPEESTTPPTLDYLTMYQATMSQKSAKSFVTACERLEEDVRVSGLTEDELADAEAYLNNVVRTDIVYDFEYQGNGSVLGTCSVAGKVMDNVFRYVEFKVRDYRDIYTIEY